MTANQLKYWQLQEDKRANVAKEQLESSKQDIARAEVPAKYISAILSPLGRLIPGVGSLLQRRPDRRAN